MKKLIYKFLSYFCVGGMAAIIEWIAFTLFNLGLNYQLATLFSFILATIANYFLGKKLTFKNNKHNKYDIIRVFFVSGIGLIFNELLMYLFIGVLKFNYEILSKILSTGIVFIWNFLSRILFIYNKEIYINQNEKP